MPAKVCPRCGAQYQNLKSKTCPQCFAVLVSVDDATAEELAAARAQVEASPEFQEARAEDDERFKEQSFGACLGVLGITLATILLTVVLVVSAAHRHTSHGPPALILAQPHPTGSRIGKDQAPSPPAAAPEPLTTLPVSAAGLDEVLPPDIGPYKRLGRDAATVLTGTLTPLFHARYAAPGGPALDVYALPAGRPTDEQNQFRLGVTLASGLGGAARPLLFFNTEYWHFAALSAAGAGPSAPAAFRDALAIHFRSP